MKTKDWENEFDDKFKGSFISSMEGGHYVDVYLKDFIRTIANSLLDEVAKNWDGNRCDEDNVKSFRELFK